MTPLNFNNSLNDFCETFYFGSRGDSEKGFKETWWLTALRVASFFTIIIPIIVTIIFIITSLLLIPINKETKEMWEGKVVCENKSFKKHFVDRLSRSGITDTTYEKIYFLRTALNGAGCRSFAEDGHFSDTPP